MRLLSLITVLLATGLTGTTRLAAQPTAGQPSAGTARRPALNTLTPQEIADGWVLLFDGSTSFGWSPREETQAEVKEGAVVLSGGRGVLSTNSEFADFTLKAQVWIDDQANSGILLRGARVGPITENNAYEVNIYDAHPRWPTGSINGVARTRTRVSTVRHWSDVEIEAVGDHLRVSIDGQTTVDTRSNRFNRGPLALQYNGQGVVAFRNLKLKPASLKPIFDGKDLTGWTPVSGFPAAFSVTPEGWLNVKNGPGELQTQEKFGDFALQLDCISNGDHLNSGVFFREDPGSFWTGYECQIRNQWEGDDRTKAVDFGTGGIYNRQPARRVVSSDHEWFTVTILAAGAHLATWIDGYPVADYTDGRPEAATARQGLRVRAGVFGIQGHDKTTDLSFRNLRAGELPEEMLRK